MAFPVYIRVTPPIHIHTTRHSIRSTHSLRTTQGTLYILDTAMDTDHGIRAGLAMDTVHGSQADMDMDQVLDIRADLEVPDMGREADRDNATNGSQVFQ
ncbi:hypothetical protein [Paenibacillus solani]|uniref:Uncharacterized protein n=1 Tax=Paenibacillus solani TaxID=1705565 RepID=A0A0M1P142_9BACL|nr:hypothetical protein [Paenibacillus solani]KOR88102.1 hypothetical protein AM231_02390 [Paenibacillus solani]